MNKIAMIAAAGRGSRMMSLTENNPKAMLPFNGKPIIGHHLEYLIDEGFNEVVIIVGYQKDKLINYVNNFYSKKINIRFAEQYNLNGLAGAISAGLNVLNRKELENSTLLILLGDIILKDKLNDYSYDFVGYNTVEDWSRWCMVELNKDSEVLRFIDKPNEKPNTDKNIMGVYNLTNPVLLWECLENVFDMKVKINGEYQISQALSRYIKHNSIHGINITNYYDLGELNDLNNTRKNISRYFNSITVTDNNSIIKTSTDKRKIKNEILWYLNLPNKLKVYTPQLIDHKEDSYELEFIHSSPIQELYLFNFPEEYQWYNIFKEIKKFIDISKTEGTGINLKESNTDMIINKTVERVEQLNTYDFYDFEFITINNIVYKNPIKHLEKILNIAKDKFCNNEIDYKHASHLHGDLFFGNMLFDVNTNVLKVIDPRGSYGDFGNYGDIRYDIAKLNHSINGYYDFIVNELYFVEGSGSTYHYHIYESDQHRVQDIFNETILKDYNREEIDLLTGLLFLTMIPLHKDNENNQKMQFITATQFLNKFI